MSKVVISALYDDDDILLAGVKQVREKGHHIQEVFSPFPIHGLDHAMGLARTRIAIAAFIYGCIGLSLAVLMTKYMMIDNWPQDIGGKPSQTWWKNMTSFIPILFESTVLCTAHLMVITFYFRSKLYPGAKASNPDPRTTDDKFLMEVTADASSVEDVKAMLKETGAIEVTEQQHS